jgi:hypothetical protein
MQIPEKYTDKSVKQWINTIADLPHKLEHLVEDFDDLQLDTPYRPEGWTVRQVIHHMADSHLNAYIRFKWTLTEDRPTIKAYHEDRWATLEDAKDADIEMSLNLIESLHRRWVYMLKSLTSDQLERIFIHPVSQKEISLAQTIAMYAWHSEHHFAHITSLAKREDWI